MSFGDIIQKEKDDIGLMSLVGNDSNQVKEVT